jgi:hypothetical protein
MGQRPPIGGRGMLGQTVGQRTAALNAPSQHAPGSMSPLQQQIMQQNGRMPAGPTSYPTGPGVMPQGGGQYRIPGAGGMPMPQGFDPSKPFGGMPGMPSMEGFNPASMAPPGMYDPNHVGNMMTGGPPPKEQLGSVRMPAPVGLPPGTPQMGSLAAPGGGMPPPPPNAPGGAMGGNKGAAAQPPPV